MTIGFYIRSCTGTSGPYFESVPKGTKFRLGVQEVPHHGRCAVRAIGREGKNIVVHIQAVWKVSRGPVPTR